MQTVWVPSVQSASEPQLPLKPCVLSMHCGLLAALVTQLHVALPVHAGALLQMSPVVGQTPTVVVVVEVLVDVLVEVLVELVVVVAETQAEPVLNESAVGQPPEHA